MSIMAIRLILMLASATALLFVNISIGQLPEWSYCEGNQWNTDPYNCYSGSPSLSTGNLNNQESRCIHGVVTGPGTIEFAWKLSPKPGPSFKINYSFFINDVMNASCSENPEWQNIKLPIEPGEKEIKWIFRFTDNRGRVPPPIFASGAGYLAGVRFNNTECKCILNAPKSDLYIRNLLRENDEICISDRANFQRIINNLKILQDTEVIGNKTFLLENGYYRPITVEAKNLTIKSKNSFEVITIDGIASDHGIILDNTSNVIIEDVSIENSIYGIIIDNSRDCIIRKDTIDSICGQINCGAPIYINNSTGIRLERIMIPEMHISDKCINDKRGIWLSNSSRNFIGDISFNEILAVRWLYYFEQASSDNIIFDRFYYPPNQNISIDNTCLNNIWRQYESS